MTALVGTVPGMSYPRDMSEGQWELMQPLFNAPGQRGASDLRTVVNTMLSISQTGCQWR